MCKRNSKPEQIEETVRAIKQERPDLTTFIEIEVNSRSASLISENRKLREENEQLKKQVESLRSLNWVDMLEEHLTEGKDNGS